MIKLTNFKTFFKAFLPITEIRPKDCSIEESILKNDNVNNIGTDDDNLKKRNIDIKQLEERYKFQLQQEKCHVTELQAAIMQVFFQ